MSTLETLFVQIFDRKKWIEDQLKQQRDLYDQYLASTLLINGIRPPSWLLSSGFQGGSAETKELKKEELISGLLFPPPRPNIASNIGRNTLYRRPFVTESNAQQSDGFTETCASNKYLDVGNKLTLVGKCNISNSENDMGCTLEVVPELDQTIFSPKDQADSRMSDVGFGPEQSLAMIQRSRSRQKALELRNSSNSKSKKRSIEDCTSVSSGRVTRSRSCGQPTKAKELLELENLSNTINGSGGRDTSSDRLTVERTSGQPTLATELLELANLSNTIHGSKDKVGMSKGKIAMSRFAAQKLNSMEKPVLSLSFAEGGKYDNILVTKSPAQYSSSGTNPEFNKNIKENAEVHPNNGSFADEYCGKITTSETTHQQIGHNEGLLKPNKSSKVPCRRVTRSRSNSNNKASQLPNLSNSVEPQNLLNASDAQVITVPCNEGSTYFIQETCNKAVAEVKLNSEVPVAVCLDHSRYSNIACTLGTAKVGLASGGLNEDHTYVEPKRLLFDDVGDCNLNKIHSPSLNKEIWDGLTEQRATSPEPPESSREPIVSDLYERHVPSVDSHFLEEDPKLVPVDGRASHEDRCNSVRTEKSDPVFLPECIGKTSDFCVMPSKEETEVYEDIVADSFSERDTSKQELLESSEEFSNANEIQEKGPLVDLLDEDQITEVVSSEKVQRASLEVSEVEKFESFQEKSKCHIHQPLSTGKGSDTYPPLALKRGTSERTSGGTKILEHLTDLSDHLAALDGTKKKSLAHQSDMEGDWSPLDVDMEFHKVSFSDMCSSMLDAKPAEILEKKCELASDGCNTPERSMSSDPNHVTGFSLLKNQVLSVGDEETEVDVATDAAILSVQRQLNNTTQGAFYLSRNNSLKEDGDPSSSRSCFAKKSMHSPEVIYDAMENTWPPFKRRKIDSSTRVATSPKLTWVEPLHQIGENNPDRVLKDVRDASGSNLQFQHICSSSDVEVAHTNSTGGPGFEMYRSEKRCKMEGYQSSEFTAKEADQMNEREDRLTSIMLGVKGSLTETLHISNVDIEANEDSRLCFNYEVGLTDMTARQFILEDHQNSGSSRCKLNLERMKEAVSTEEISHENQPDIGELLFPSVKSIDKGLDLNAADSNLPEFEGFRVGVNIPSPPAEDSTILDKLDLPCTTRERVSVLEKICKSTSMLSQLPQSSMYKSPKAQDKSQSFPTGLLESMYLRNTVLFNDDDINQLTTSYNLMGVDADRTFYSVSMPSSVQQDWGVRKPPTPPFRRASPKIISVSASPHSEKKQSVNPELTCFRIDEDTSTSEGNVNFDEVIDVVREGSSPRDDISSTYRNPLTDVTNTNCTESASVSKMFRDRGSLDSVNTELNFHGTNMSGKQNIGNGYAKTRLSKNKDKENQSSSVVRNGAEKSSSLRSGFTRSKLSGKASDKKGRLEKGYKQTNIVSNVSSFVPLVQQKLQQPALITGKRDIKVKSLEVAEAAKRVAEKRENDRKMKKEAAKAARERLEQEKIKQMELSHKNKEEERKKKEANMAAKKRLREEEERKEKEKKRKLMLQKGEKMRAGKEHKESHCRDVEEREGKRKHQKTEKGRDVTDCRKATNTCNRVTEVSSGHVSKASGAHEVAEAFKMSPDKTESILSGAYDNGYSFIGESGEQSYEMSPYQASDDEDEEEADVMPNNKFRPSWAREKALDSVLPLMQQVDPLSIFPPTSFCSTSQILMPRMNF